MKILGRHWRIIVLVFIGWTLFGVFFALQNQLNSAYQGHAAPFGRTLTIWLICGYGWALLTPFVLYLSEKVPVRREKIGRSLSIHFLAASILAVLHFSIFISVRQLIFGSPPERAFSFWEEFQRLFVTEYHVDLLIYWILVGIWNLREIHRRYLERERVAARLALETSQLETKLARAQLDALKMQLHPHFLFNTLNSISVLIRDDAETANKMLVRLSELLRIALKSESSQEVSLKDELEFLRGYLEIEQTRFQDRLVVDFEVEEETLDALVPNLILQPLVENAIRHGIAPRAEAGKILIETRRRNGFIELSVSDNGAGLSDSVKMSNGIGLKNTQERLEKLYGEKQKFEVISGAGGGLEVKIKIPYHKNEQ